MNTELDKAAEKYASNGNWQFDLANADNNVLIRAEAFKAGAQWQLEQKQVPTDEEIEKLAEKEYPEDTTWELYHREGYRKGFKAALQYSVDNKYWEGFGYALALLDEMYSKSYNHPYNVADCIKAKVNRLDKDKIRPNEQYSVGDGENIAIEFAKWKDDNGWKLDYQEQSTHSYEEHFYHFIHNVYKTPINK